MCHIYIYIYIVTDLLVNYFNQETKWQISKQKRKNDEKQFQTFILIKNQNRQNKLIFNFSKYDVYPVIPQSLLLNSNPTQCTNIQDNEQLSKTMNNYPRQCTNIQSNFNWSKSKQHLNEIQVESLECPSPPPYIP